MAHPAEFKEAEAACHVIAALCPFYFRLAHGALGYVFLVAKSFLVDVLKILIACLVRMPGFFAVEANFRGAYWARQVFYFFALRFHLSLAVRFGAVAQIFVERLLSL